MQYFKGDALEKKFADSAGPVLDLVSSQKDTFFTEAFDAMNLGDVLFTGNRSPLSDAIKQSVFRQFFNTLFSAFITAGTFESYLTVFRKIFGEAVAIVFTVPAPGKLSIDINADTIVLSDFVARHIELGAYLYDNVIYEDTDGTGNIEFQSVQGFQSQYELERMLFELVPGGIYTQISLNFV